MKDSCPSFCLCPLYKNQISNVFKQALFLTGQDNHGYMEIFTETEVGIFSYAVNIVILLSRHCTCSTQQITIKFQLQQTLHKF